MTTSYLPKTWVLPLLLAGGPAAWGQASVPVRVVKDAHAQRVDVFMGSEVFTRFWYPDTLEKPVLYPMHAASGAAVTRGFPINPQPGDPTDHPHHLGLWLNFENVNGLDFWNNSYAIAPDNKASYGWIRTDEITEATSGSVGTLAYHANWTNQQRRVLLEETTRFEFSGTAHARTIDRVTTLRASTDVAFTDAKDGLLGLRLAHTLQMPTTEAQKFTDNKGNVTVVRGGTDQVATGTYLTSTGKRGNAAWSSRAAWCEAVGKIGADSVSVAIIDHPLNPNYPTFWHARGYGLFAANPLGEAVFTNGQSAKNLHLRPGETVTFRYRILIADGRRALTTGQLNGAASEFARKRLIMAGK